MDSTTAQEVAEYFLSPFGAEGDGNNGKGLQRTQDRAIKEGANSLQQASLFTTHRGARPTGQMARRSLIVFGTLERQLCGSLAKSNRPGFQPN